MPDNDGKLPSPGDFFANVLGSLRSTDERKRVIARLRRREALLQAVHASAVALVRSRDFDAVMPVVLGLFGAAAVLTRAQLIETVQGGDGGLAVRLRAEWQAVGAAPPYEGQHSEPLTPQSGLPPSWQELLTANEVVTPPPQGEGGAGGRLNGAASLMLVPVAADGAWWGALALGDGRAGRTWQADEAQVAKALAELIGAWIARRQPERALEDAARISANSPTVLFGIAARDNWPFTYVSENISRYGYDARTLIGSAASVAGFIHPEDRDVVRGDLRRLLKGAADQVRLEYRVRAADGSYRWSESHLSAVRNAEGRTLSFEGTVSDIEDRHRLESRMVELAQTDMLTGLANRSAFLERLSQAFSAAARGSAPFALLYLDLDGFKDVNDSYGHPTGDLLLQAVAERLKKTVRGADLVARLGGDEFAILQANVSDPEGAGALSAKVGTELAAPYVIAGHEAQVTVSIGIAPYASTAKKPSEIIAQADRALYRAKDEGGNQYRFHSTELDERVHERIVLANELRAGIARNELELYYQPQVELASGRIAGMEALVRWNHPQRGQLLPALFVPIAEKTGGIQPLGQWVLEQAFRQFGRWRGDGIAPPFISLNLSAAQFKSRPEIEDKVAEDLRMNGIAADAVELELTEAVFMEATRARETSLGRLRQLGLRIAIDDFGTGYSSLESLRDNRVSRLKIAPQYIRAMMTDPGSAAIVRAAIGLARELGIESVAQGVEDDEQRGFLADAGCRYLQGYYFSEPVGAEHAAELLHRGTLAPLGRGS